VTISFPEKRVRRGDISKPLLSTSLQDDTEEVEIIQSAE
jgi:hypothetical protein